MKLEAGFASFIQEKVSALVKVTIAQYHPFLSFLRCIVKAYYNGGTQATGCYTEVTFLRDKFIKLHSIMKSKYKKLSFTCSSRYIEIKYYSVAYFERITEFDALWR